MRRDREARLARVAAARGRAERADEQRRRTLAARVAVCTLVRGELARRGLDPAGAAALRLGSEAAAHLAGLGDAPAPPGSDPAPGGGGPGPAAAALFEAKILGLARRYWEEGAPDLPDNLATASPAELFAWCLLPAPARRPPLIAKTPASC